MARISTLDAGYEEGDLSVFPEAIDDRESLYEARNNAETTLIQSLPFNGKAIHVEDASGFPPAGLLRIGPRDGSGIAEFIHYGSRTNTIFKDLTRGFAGTIQTKWESSKWSTNAVFAEHHNALKDAIVKIQRRLGLKDFPDEGSLNFLLKQLEVKHVAPKAAFRAFPAIGPPPLNVRFQNFSNNAVIRFLWDFGDGTTSIERNPNHTYQSEGIYTVKLNVISSTGSACSTIKNNYITVSETNKTPFYYFVQDDPSVPAFSEETALANSTDPAIFNFVDQTDADIASRFWIFDDGQTETQLDPNIHSTAHTYESPGEYNPFLLIILNNGNNMRVFPQESLIVL